MAKKKSAKKTVSEREVVHPKVRSVVCSGDTAITIPKAKQLLGWREVEGGEYLFKDHRTKRIVCDNNVTNRPIYNAVIERLKQDLLRRRWVLNGEPIIIGRTGLILNGQHTLIALVLTEQEIALRPKVWGALWADGPPTMDKVIIYGIAEDDDTVNTMDTCKPRSFADALFRSEYYDALPKGSRQKMAKA